MGGEGGGRVALEEGAGGVGEDAKVEERQNSAQTKSQLNNTCRLWFPASLCRQLKEDLRWAEEQRLAEEFERKEKIRKEKERFKLLWRKRSSGRWNKRSSWQRNRNQKKKENE